MTLKEKVETLLKELISRREEHMEILQDLKVLKTKEDGELYTLHTVAAIAYSECIGEIKKILK
jgi:hypothetical protein